MATGNRFLTASQFKLGTTASGNSDWMVKRSPMVSMQVMPPYIFIRYTAIVTTTMATNEPGIFFENLGVTAMMMILMMLTIVFHQLMLPKWWK